MSYVCPDWISKTIRRTAVGKTLGIMRVQLKASLKSLVHDKQMIPRGLRRKSFFIKYIELITNSLCHSAVMRDQCLNLPTSAMVSLEFSLTGIFPPPGKFPSEGSWLCEICCWREPVPTRVLNPNASEASYKPKQRSYKKTWGGEFSGGDYT